LANTPNSVSKVIDKNYVTYTSGTDYEMVTAGVHWLDIAATVNSYNPAAYTGLSGSTFLVTANGSALPTVTFTAVTSAVMVADAIAVALTPTISATVYTAGSDSYIKLTTASGNGSIIVIGAGTANSTIGFYQGASYLGSLRPASAVDFYVDYRTNKVTADYLPTYYSSLTDIVNDFGSPDESTNTLTLGAQIAIQNGASVILATQLNAADGAVFTQFESAIDKLQTVDCNIVCPMTGDTNLFSYIKTHVDNMSSVIERRQRTAILGLTGSWTTTDIKNIAGGLSDNRVMLVYPTAVKLYVGTDATETSVGGFYLAAAIAGIRCNANYDVAEPITRKTVVGFTELTDNLTRTQMNDLANSGVTIVESVNGVFRVRDGLTTKTDTVENQEYTITEIVDYVGYVCWKITEQMYVGTKILTETPTQVAATNRILLQNLVKLNIITGFTNPTAVQNPNIKTEVNVYFSILPVYTLKYIPIRYSISTL
jgi:hypothetical protein